jgi:predicted enzyme related to lactoylglutathione lyase
MKRIVHFEIHAKNLDRMQKFYQDIFGWNIKDMGPQMSNYRIVMTGKDAPEEKWPGINGGLMPRLTEIPTSNQPVNAFVCTINVDDINLYIEQVKKAGGLIALDVMDVPNVGKLVYCKDIENNIFGMLQPI